MMSRRIGIVANVMKSADTVVAPDTGSPYGLLSRQEASNHIGKIMRDDLDESWAGVVDENRWQDGFSEG